MYPLTPLRVYALDRVYDDPTCVARMERMLRSIGHDPKSVVRISSENLAVAARELETLWHEAVVPQGAIHSYMRPLIFTLMDLSYHRQDIEAIRQQFAPEASPDLIGRIYGHLTTAIDQHPHNLDRIKNCVCWPTYNFGTVSGCSHGCLYCSAGRCGDALTIALNLEEYMNEVVKPVIEANPWNRVFRMILNGADLMTLEPEYGLHDLFTRTLAEYDDRWGHFHTASSNVDWLADLPHRDRLVGVWSLTCDTVATSIEGGTGQAADRIVAARTCQDMGIPVRFKFKPVIPVANWREEYARIIEYAMTRTTPESVGFCLYIWNSYESMVTSLPVDLLDKAYVEAARAAQDEMKDVRTGPFPHAVRKEIYRHLIREVRRWNKDVPLYISTESREMWDELKDELGQDPLNYVCGCSSVAIPGGGVALSPGLRYSTYSPTPV